MERDPKMDQLKNLILTYESTRHGHSAFAESTPRQHSCPCHDQTPTREYGYEHFNQNSIYLKHRQTDDLFRCSHCDHVPKNYAKPLRRHDKDRFLSYSCHKASPTKYKLVRRRISSLFRPKYVTAEERANRPLFCDVCEQGVTKYVEQKWCVTPLFNTKGSASRRPVNSSSYKNMIRDQYAKRHQNSIEISSDTLLADAESEHFVRSTSYSIKNSFEEDLKQALLKEYLKRKRKHNRCQASSSSTSLKDSSKEFSNFLFKDAKRRFKELNRKAKDKTRPKLDQACYTINTPSSAHLPNTKETEGRTVLTQTSCSCACRCANENSPSQIKGSGNANVDKNSGKFSLRELCSKFTGSTAIVTGNDDIIRNSSSHGIKLEIKKDCTRGKQAKTKKQTNIVPNNHNESNIAKDLISTITGNISSPHSDESAASSLEQEPKSNISVQSSGSCTDVQSQETNCLREVGTSQQVMFINNPSCTVVEGGHLHSSQENLTKQGLTQTGDRIRSNNKSEMCCQCTSGNNSKIHRPAQVVKFESGHKVQNSDCREFQRPKRAREMVCECQTYQKSAVKICRPRQVIQSIMVDDSQDWYQRQMFDQYRSRQHADKVVQSVCLHDPPCEMVPSCFKVQYKLDLTNYCVHVPVCARVPMCSMPRHEKSELEYLSSRQVISLLKGNAGTQEAKMVRSVRTVQVSCVAVKTACKAVQKPYVAVQTCSTQRAWISAHDKNDKNHQTPVEQPPMSATCPTRAHAACSSDGSVLSAKTAVIQTQKPKLSFISGSNRFMKIFSRHRHKRSS